MDIGKALSYITEDPRWKEKVAIGTGVILLSGILSVVLIGIVGFLIVMGYTVRLLQNVRDGHPQPLPEWDQWGEDLVRGLKLAVVALVWSLPMILFSIPMTLGGALADGRGTGAFVGSVILIGGSCLMVLYGIFLAIAQASFTIAYAEDEKISSGLQVREIWDWTMANIGQLVIVALAYIVVSIGVSLVGSIVGVLLCLIGLVVTLPLAQLVIYLFQYHLYGQLAAAYPFGSVRGTRDWSDDPMGGAAAGAAVGGAATSGATETGATESDVTESDVTESAAGEAPVTTAPSAADSGSTFEDNPYAAYGPPSDLDESALGTPEREAPASVDEITAEATGVSLEDETTLAATATPETGTSGIATTGESTDVAQSEPDEAYPDSGIASSVGEVDASEGKPADGEDSDDEDKPKSTSA